MCRRTHITIGVAAYRDEHELTLGKLLALPFREQRPWRLPNGDVPGPCDSARRSARRVTFGLFSALIRGSEMPESTVFSGSSGLLHFQSG